MKRVLIVLLLLAVPAYAQLDWAVTDLRCGNGKLDDFELCEPDIGDGYCEDLGKLLKVAAVCDEQHCTCLPRVNKAFCGNNIREGIELCDGDAEDFCEEFGNITGVDLVCNKDTCGCDIADAVPSDYNPLVIDELKNKSQEEAVCGDKKVERDEECDPPNTLCTIGLDDSGICTEQCKCVPPELYGKEESEEPQEAEQKETENETIAPANITDDLNASVPNENETEKPKEQKGFFASVWAWIVALFS